MVIKIIEKISSYNIFNYLFPGVIFSHALKKIYGIDILTSNTLSNLFIYYFAGLIISRIGSLFIGSFLDVIRVTKKAPYKEYIEASKIDSKIDLLSEVNNMYRTLISLFISLISIKWYLKLENKVKFIEKNHLEILLILLTLLFVFSYRKQTSFIRKRIKKNIEKKEKK